MGFPPPPGRALKVGQFAEDATLTDDDFSNENETYERRCCGCCPSRRVVTAAGRVRDVSEEVNLRPLPAPTHPEFCILLMFALTPLLFREELKAGVREAFAPPASGRTSGTTATDRGASPATEEDHAAEFSPLSVLLGLLLENQRRLLLLFVPVLLASLQLIWVKLLSSRLDLSPLQTAKCLARVAFWTSLLALPVLQPNLVDASVRDRGVEYVHSVHENIKTHLGEEHRVSKLLGSGAKAATAVTESGSAMGEFFRARDQMLGRGPGRVGDGGSSLRRITGEENGGLRRIAGEENSALRRIAGEENESETMRQTARHSRGAAGSGITTSFAECEDSSIVLGLHEVVRVVTCEHPSMRENFFRRDGDRARSSRDVLHRSPKVLFNPATWDDRKQLSSSPDTTNTEPSTSKGSYLEDLASASPTNANLPLNFFLISAFGAASFLCCNKVKDSTQETAP